MKLKTKHIFLIIIVIISITTFSYLFFRKKKKSLGNLENNFFDDTIIVENEKGKNQEIKIKFSGWFNPYDENGKTNFNKLTKHKFGVYFIRSKQTQKIVYVGFSQSNLYKALYRHFQHYNDTNRQIRNQYPKTGFDVMIALCKQKDAAALEKHFIIDLQPKDCTFKYQAYTEKQTAIEIPAAESVDEFWEFEPVEEIPF